MTGAGLTCRHGRLRHQMDVGPRDPTPVEEMMIAPSIFANSESR